jgi:hypothetical protein
MKHAFNDVVVALTSVINEQLTNASPVWTPDLREKEVKICLRFYYYWLNYSPLSRGSAAVGYAVLVGCVLAMGDVLMQPLPPGIQLDWEAMFEANSTVFADKAYIWLQDRQPAQSIMPECWVHTLPIEPSCSLKSIFNTTRAMLYAINGY